MNDIGTGKNFPSLKPPLHQRVASYMILGFLVVPVMTFFMRVLNRTRMTGKERLRQIDGPWILMSNHVTLLDDMFLGPIIFFPHGMRSYELMPYHAPEERNFYKVPLVAWFMRRTKSIPVMRGKGIHQEGVNLLIEAVKNGGLLHIYPEGTRTRTGDLGKAKAGIGRIVYESGAPVVPMYHMGLEKVLPIGAGVPKIGKKIYVSIGDPITFEMERQMPNNPETWRLISGRIMSGIRNEQERLKSMYEKELATRHGDEKANSTNSANTFPHA